MIASLKAELRKIYTVRSTYAILAFSVIMILLFGFYTEGIKAGESSKAVTDPFKLTDLVRDATTNLAFFGALVGILAFTYEYRYNLIMYTLTASKSRTKTLLAKLTAVSIFSVFFTAFISVLAVALMYVGLAIKGYTLSHQEFPLDLIWRVLFMAWGSCMMGLLLGALIRQQIGALAAYFVIPSIVESLLGLLLKDDRIYLPFLALQQVTGLMGSDMERALSHGKAALVVTAYLIVGWLVAWILFLRRDATS